MPLSFSKIYSPSKKKNSLLSPPASEPGSLTKLIVNLFYN